MKRTSIRSIGMLTLILSGLPTVGPAQDMRVHVRDVVLEEFPRVHVTFSLTSPHRLDFRRLASDHLALTEEEVPIRDFKVAPVSSQIALGLVLDDSGSMDPELNNLKRALYRLVDYMAAGDEAAVVSFARGVQVVSPLTSKKRALVDAISRLRSYGASALYDGIAVGISEVFRGHGKRALLIVTDGVDQAFTGGHPLSRENLDGIIAMARAHRVEIHAIGLGPRVDHHVLRDLCGFTGGRYYPSPSPESLMALLEQLGLSMHGTFRLSYVSPRPVEDDALRQVRLWARFRDHRGSTVFGYQVRERTPTEHVAVTREKVYQPDTGDIQLFTLGIRGTHLPLDFYMFDEGNHIVRQGATTPDGYGSVDGGGPELIRLHPGMYRLELSVPGTILRYRHPGIRVTAGSSFQHTFRYSKLLFRRNRVVWYDTPHPLGDTSDLISVKVVRTADGGKIYDGRLIDFKEGRETFLWLEQGTFQVELDNLWKASTWPDVERAVLKNRLTATVESSGSKILFFDVVDADFVESGHTPIPVERELRPVAAAPEEFSETLLRRTRSGAGLASPSDEDGPASGTLDLARSGSSSAGAVVDPEHGVTILTTATPRSPGDPGTARAAAAILAAPPANPPARARLETGPAAGTAGAIAGASPAALETPAARAASSTVDHLRELARSLESRGVRPSRLMELARSLEPEQDPEAGGLETGAAMAERLARTGGAPRRSERLLSVIEAVKAQRAGGSGDGPAPEGPEDAIPWLGRLPSPGTEEASARGGWGDPVPPTSRSRPGSPAAHSGPGRTPPPGGTSSTGRDSPHGSGEPEPGPAPGPRAASRPPGPAGLRRGRGRVFLRTGSLLGAWGQGESPVGSLAGTGPESPVEAAGSLPGRSAAGAGGVGIVNPDAARPPEPAVSPGNPTTPADAGDRGDGGRDITRELRALVGREPETRAQAGPTRRRGAPGVAADPATGVPAAAATAAAASGAPAPAPAAAAAPSVEAPGDPAGGGATGSAPGPALASPAPRRDRPSPAEFQAGRDLLLDGRVGAPPRPPPGPGRDRLPRTGQGPSPMFGRSSPERPLRTDPPAAREAVAGAPGAGTDRSGAPTGPDREPGGFPGTVPPRLDPSRAPDAGGQDPRGSRRFLRVLGALRDRRRAASAGGHGEDAPGTGGPDQGGPDRRAPDRTPGREAPEVGASPAPEDRAVGSDVPSSATGETPGSLDAGLRSLRALAGGEAGSDPGRDAGIPWRAIRGHRAAPSRPGRKVNADHSPADAPAQTRAPTRPGPGPANRPAAGDGGFDDDLEALRGLVRPDPTAAGAEAGRPRLTPDGAVPPDTGGSAGDPPSREGGPVGASGASGRASGTGTGRESGTGRYGKYGTGTGHGSGRESEESGESGTGTGSRPRNRRARRHVQEPLVSVPGTAARAPAPGGPGAPNPYERLLSLLDEAQESDGKP